MIVFMQRHILKCLLSIHFVIFSGRARPALPVSIVVRRCRMIRSVRMAYRIHNPVQQVITVQMAQNMPQSLVVQMAHTGKTHFSTYNVT